MNYVKVDSIVVIGNAVIVHAENTKTGVKAYIAGDELELDQLTDFIGRYKILDKNGNPVPRIKGNNYMEEGALFVLSSNDDDEEDEEESSEWDDDNNGGDMISSNDIEKAKRVCAAFGENYEKKGKKWTTDSINKASVGIIRNTEYKKLTDVIGYHATLDAVAKMYGSYFDDGTFKDIATEVIPMYFKEDVDMTTTIKELQFRHNNEN